MRSSKEAWDVFQVDDGRSYSAKHVEGGGPHVPLVVGSFGLACDAERLAWEARRNQVCNSSEVVSVTGECTDVPPDWSGVEESIAHPRREYPLGVVVPFDVADACVTEDVLVGDVATTCTCKKTEVVHSLTTPPGSPHPSHSGRTG